ncbi:MAG: hypothetical protein IBJ17_09215, partial [Reyranella sp.]|nr:hypothetical protein [Reyranella sp.]
MSGLDFSGVPRMPDGRTAAEHILTVERTASEVVRVCSGGGRQMTWRVWSKGPAKGG